MAPAAPQSRSREVAHRPWRSAPPPASAAPLRRGLDRPPAAHRRKPPLGGGPFAGSDLGIEEAARLAAPQRGVMAPMVQQLLVRALLDDMAALEHDQAVHAGDGR